MKKIKNIGITDDTKRNLLIQAIEKGISLKLHCENILEKAAESNNIKGVAIEVDFSSDKPAVVHHLDTGEKEELKPEVSSGGSMRAKKGNKKYEKVGTNLFYNGDNYMARKYVNKKFVEEYFPTEDEAREYLNG